MISFRLRKAVADPADAGNSILKWLASCETEAAMAAKSLASPPTSSPAFFQMTSGSAPTLGEVVLSGVQEFGVFALTLEEVAGAV